MKKIKLLISPFFVLISAMFLFTGCEEEYTPKPRSYFRIDFPEKEYATLDTDCPFSFDVPVYAQVKPDNEGITEPCWMNMDFPKYNARLHLSYKAVESNLNQYLEDSRTLTYKHTSKATDIRESLIANESSRVYGLVYDVKGDAASPLQFYLTDSTNHFLRGSLYFNVAPNQDSLAPVLSFIRQDVSRMFDSFEWK